MKRLFKIEKQSRVGPTSSPGFDVDAGTEGTLKILMEEVQGSLPREVQIAYKTATGETHYLTFTQPCHSPGLLSTYENSCMTEPAAEDILGSAGVKRDSGYRIGCSDGEEDVEDSQGI